MIQLVGKQEGQNSQINWPRKSGQRGHLGLFGCQEYLWPFIWWMRQKVVVPTIHHIPPLHQRKHKVNAINSRHPRGIEIPECDSLKRSQAIHFFLFLLKMYSDLEILWLTFFMVAEVAGGFF